MNKKSLKLTGRVVSINHADQSVLLESTEKSNRLRVYADDKGFKKLIHSFQSAWFNGANGKELTGTFYIQGRVLKMFKVSKTAVVRINNLYLETNKDCRSLLDFVRLITRAVHPEPSK